jgi:hypothetical protein
MRIVIVLAVVLALGFGVVQLFAGEGGKNDDDAAGKAADTGSTDAAEGETASEKKAAPNDERFHAALKGAAALYKGYGRVDDEVRWAPYLCRMPMPSAVRFSTSEDAKTHGQKLYWLYAKDRTDYIDKFDPKTPVPIGQVIVKESWEAETVAEMPEGRDAWANETSKIVSDGEIQTGWTKESIRPKGETIEVESAIKPYAEKDGKVYKAKAVKGLFVMMKLDPETEGTDEGWIYGTLTADGKTVTSAGKVSSCIKCHKQAKRERLFGLAK